MDDNIKKTVFSAIQKELNINPEEIDPKQDLRQEAVMDSMQFVSLIARIELLLDIQIPISIMEISTLNEFLDVIDQVLAEKV